MIRIVHVIDHLGAGGAQEFLLNLVGATSRSRFRMEVCTLHGWGPYAEELETLRIPVYSLSGSKFDPFIPFRLWRFLSHTRYGILHLHLSASILFGCLAGRLARVPKIIATIHALRNQSLPWVFPLYGLLSRLMDRLVAEASLSRRELAEAGVPDEKIETIILGTDTTLAANASADRASKVRREFGIAQEEPLILNIARLHKHKGQIHLLRVMKELLREWPSAKLLIVGDGPLRTSLEKAARQLSLTNDVIFAGFRRDLADLYSACDLVVVPSVKEGLGMTTIQAMAWGKPVVAFEVGALSEAVIDGETGYLVPAKDHEALLRAIAALLGDPVLRVSLGSQAKALVEEKFALHTMVKEYERLYESLARAPA